MDDNSTGLRGKNNGMCVDAWMDGWMDEQDDDDKEMNYGHKNMRMEARNKWINNETPTVSSKKNKSTLERIVCVFFILF